MRLWLGLMILGLAGVLFMVLWPQRFEQAPNARPIGLAELRKQMPNLPPSAQWLGEGLRTTLRFEATRNPAQWSFVFKLPALADGNWLAIRARVRSEKLILGKMPWDDGRMVIVWRAQRDPKYKEIDAFISTRGSQNAHQVFIVTKPSQSELAPQLYIENLGKSGTFEVSSLEMIECRESQIWKIGRWILGSMTLLGFTLIIHGRRRAFFPRAFLAGCVVTALIITLAVPGPWRHQRSFILPFLINFSPPPVVTMPVQPPPAPHASGVKNTDANAKNLTSNKKTIPAPVVNQTPPPPPIAAAQVPIKHSKSIGDWLIVLKYQFGSIRPLLHGLLLMLPTLVLILLVGQRRAFLLAIAISLGIEGSQVAFGYSFDLQDVFDLVSNTLGICVALALWKFLAPRCSWLEKLAPREMACHHG